MKIILIARFLVNILQESQQPMILNKEVIAEEENRTSRFHRQIKE